MRQAGKRDLRLAWLGVALAGGVTLAAPLSAPLSARQSASERRDVVSIVARASQYVRSFVDAASVLIAEEHYVQELKARNGSTRVPDGSFGITVEKRTLESEIALVHMADKQLWMLGRDVRTVDGRPIRERDRIPLVAYHPPSIDEALKHFRELATASARFNIGSMTRNVNVPSLALWFLTDGVRERFAFSRGRQERIDEELCDIVNYREKSTPFLLTAERRAIPVRGRFWVAASSGAVLRTELLLYDEVSTGGLGEFAPGDNNEDSGRAFVTVQYRYATEVAAWVPHEMTERYDYPRMMNAGTIVGKATYRNYKKFSTSSRILGPEAASQPASQPPAALNWNADDEKRIAELTKSGERRDGQLVVLFTPAGAMDDGEEQALLERLDKGVRELRAVVGRHPWQGVGDQKITYYVCAERFVAHASGRAAVFIPIARVQDGRAPWLHEAGHELLSTGIPPGPPNPERVALVRKVRPLWLTEGLADYVAQTAATRAGIAEGDVFDIGGLAGTDAACRDRLAGPRGAEVVSFIGTSGGPPALFTTERMEVAPTFYACGTSFTKFIVGRIGLPATIALMPLIGEQRVTPRIEELTGQSIDALRQQWRAAIGAK